MACTDPIAGKTFISKYVPVGVPGDECDNDICICPAGTGGDTEWFIQQGRVYTLESEDDVVMMESSLRGRRMPSPGNGFGMHLVNVSNHVTTGGLTVSEVESEFTKKLGGMSSFDAFMDFNAQYYTSALNTYIKAFEDDDVRRVR